MANKRYDQFSTGTPTGTKITLFADPSTGALSKCTLQDILNLATPAADIYALLQLLGSPIKTSVFNNNPLAANGSTNLAFQSMYFMAMYCPAGTYTGFWYQLLTVGAFNHFAWTGFAMYSQSAGILTLLRDTGWDDNIFKAGATGFRQAPLTSTVTLTAGWYWMAYLYGGGATSTVPVLATSGGNLASNAYSFGFSSSVKSVVTLASQSTPPSSVTMSTAGSSPIPIINMGLY